VAERLKFTDYCGKGDAGGARRRGKSSEPICKGQNKMFLRIKR
jgi:hypothetical protein